jgi:hypothetical protein
MGSAVLVAGAALIGTYLFGRLPGTTPENQLTIAEGVPVNVSETLRRGHHDLSFTVQGYPITYAGDEPNYQGVRSAVQSRRPIRVWVSNKVEAAIPLGRSVTLYQLHQGDHPVLTYSEVVAHQARTARAVPIVGGALLGLGALALAGCCSAQRRHAGHTSADKGQPDRYGSDAAAALKKGTWGAMLVSAAIYAVILGVNFAPEVRAKQVEALGAQPLGVPVTLLVCALETLLFLPMPWVCWHALWIAAAAQGDGKRFGIAYLLQVGKYHPLLRRSQRVCFGGLVYFAAIATTWILYTLSHGI